MAENVAEVTEKTFEAEVLQSPIPAVVDLWAPWCGPCRAMAPILDQFAQEKAGAVKVAKVNVDTDPGVATRYGVMSIPTFLIFSDGKLVGQIVGAMSKDVFEKKVEAALNSAK